MGNMNELDNGKDVSDFLNSHGIKGKNMLSQGCKNEKDLIVESIKGVSLRTKKVGVLSIDGYIDISYMYCLPPRGWHWNTNDTITHWFPLPERPKK